MPMDSAGDTACAVGCPIRRSRDQRSLASPPGFSQRATSFIASQCQGIHQMPFSCFSRHTQRQASRGSVRRAHGAERCPGASRGPSSATFLSIQKTLRAGSATAQLALHRAIPRGHNSLLHNCPSTTPRPPAGAGEAIRSFCRDVRAVSARFRRLLRKRLSRGEAGASPGVEVNGLEPSTSGLQSRRSPS